MAETQTDPKNQNASPSAQSATQLLDATTHAAFTNPTETPFRPRNLTRKSSNSVEADAHPRAALAGTDALAAQGNAPEGRNEQEDGGSAGTGSAGASWKPQDDRKQSWSQQDFKREMHLSIVIDGGEGYGFTEVGEENGA